MGLAEDADAQRTHSVDADTGETGAEGTAATGATQQQLATMKAEIDALQIGLSEKSKPWYTQSSVIISILALLFSFSTTIYSYQRTQREDVHNAKVELRDLIQRLTDIRQENLDLGKKYADDPNALLVAAGSLNIQQIVLAKQALAIVDEIPREVSATEYYAVASALAVAGVHDRTTELYQRALNSARDVHDWVDAAHGLGQTAFSVGDLARGRAAYQQALNVFKRFPSRNVDYNQNINAYTELLWAQTELGQMQCSEAKTHLERATGYYSSLQKRGWDISRYSSQLKALRSSISTTCA
jgi:tetratricopeptide (TPR) repeat protein